MKKKPNIRGEVLLNGINIKHYNRRDYYAHFSAVFQQFSILEVTLAENVAQIKTDINFDKVASCIDKAGLTSKVDHLPDKWNTHIGKMVFEDGVEFSGGETQRLMLARALYKNAPILVLDEPTAALDSIAESEIYTKFNEIVGNKTAIYISHRLSSCRFCDEIAVFDNGQIVQKGSHNNLITDQKAQLLTLNYPIL